MEGGINGVKEPEDREQEHDVGQAVSREGVPRENKRACRAC